MQLITRFTLVMLIAACAGLIASRAQAVVFTDGQEAIAAKCQADLAQRLKVPVKDITVIEVQAKVWPDAALGLPERDKMYAQVQTPGWRVVLQAKNIQYLYTGSKDACRYGGPVSLWSGSMLYLAPVPDEPNLNGDLYQCSLLGTNHVRIASGVEAYYPQENGVVLFTRRLSRSSQELFYIKVGDGKDAISLQTAFAFGEAAWNAKQNAWAALVKPAVGAGWQLVTANLGKDATSKTVPLPTDVLPQRLAWEGDILVIMATKAGKTACFEIAPLAAAPELKTRAVSDFPGTDRFVLNKSETLEVSQEGTKEKPKVEIARVWFTGDRNVKATIDGLTLRGYDFVGAGYLLVWGEKGDAQAAYTVNIATGEVFATFQGKCRSMKPFQAPPDASPN